MQSARRHRQSGPKPVAGWPAGFHGMSSLLPCGATTICVSSLLATSPCRTLRKFIIGIIHQY
jgi:hypothetical protein